MSTFPIHRLHESHPVGNAYGAGAGGSLLWNRKTALDHITVLEATWGPLFLLGFCWDPEGHETEDTQSLTHPHYFSFQSFTPSRF